MSSGELFPDDARTDRIAVVDQSLPDVAPTTGTLFEALGFTSFADFERRPRPPAQLYRVPIGVGAHGVFALDLTRLGHFGMCVGRIGCGKSELLRTIVLTLMATHTPDEVNFVLGDHMGSAMRVFKGAPHVVACAGIFADDSNIAGDYEFTGLRLLEETLHAEMRRRRELIAQAGARDAQDYLRERERGIDLPPLPLLFLALDDISEVSYHRPQFLDVLAAVARNSHDLHMHTLLTVPRIDSRLRSAVDEHVQYRIALRTFNSEESRAFIGVPHASGLPDQPGHGFLCRSDRLERFRAAFVSGIIRPHDDAYSSELDVVLRRIKGEPPGGLPHPR
ncbi:hypothetical protein HUO13_25660 [Saccharopolyspora erythraea]|uniref:FtsK/SpoIIIE domain-containing protein n=1 Tax=Saccharopolyspora erythraea TaxID=1836 RepID=UPI001BA7FED8|nr:FtsK/SpoIIIE domain-containing protein [Saccharopolyspora erythraea]QUH03753.1 hypothetical protein HUO13_25660 [Saccharopolyspora erythraea]